MKPPFQISRGLYTHIGCAVVGLVVGMVIWHAAGTSSGGSGGTTGAGTEAAQTRSSGRSREHGKDQRSGTELLKDIAPQVFATYESRAGRRSMSFATYLRGNSAGLLKAADELPPAGDVAATAIAAFDKLAQLRGNPGQRTEEELEDAKHINSRLIHWLREDPAAALQYLTGKSSDGIDTMSVIFAAMQEKGVEAAVDWWKDSRPPLAGNFPFTLAAYIGSEGDAAQLAGVQQSLTPDQWNRIRSQVVGAWPFEKADALLAFAVSQNSPRMLSGLAMRNGKEGVDWLLKHLASDALDPAFRQAITGSGEYRQLLRSNPQVPLETRLDALAPDYPGKDREEIALIIGGDDVGRALDGASKDWRFAFRNGKATFEEIYQAVSADLPELASASPDAIRLRIFKELAEENGPAAMEALAHTPEPDKWTLALKPTQWMFQNADPQRFYDYLQEIPYQDPAHHQARFESWVSHSRSNIDLFSRDYVEWVKAMPKGIDREMAAIGILRAVGKDNNLPLRTEVEELVQDPALRARIDPPPPGARK